MRPFDDEHRLIIGAKGLFESLDQSVRILPLWNAHEVDNEQENEPIGRKVEGGASAWSDRKPFRDRYRDFHYRHRRHARHCIQDEVAAYPDLIQVLKAILPFGLREVREFPEPVTDVVPAAKVF